MKYRSLLLLLIVLVPACSAIAPATGDDAGAGPAEYAAPAWFDDAVVYEIFVRSFADSDGDGIGDLNGITANLGYLSQLGIDAIWLMPIYPSPSVHGYDVSNLLDVNPEYGSLADLQALVAAAHAADLRVILDFVPSHLSDQHPFFQDAYRNPDSAYSDWFVWTNEAHTTYATFAGVGEMPRLNHYNPAVVDYLIEAAFFWMDLDGDGELDDGVDGFRIDNATFPPTELFLALREALKEANPEVLLLGEAWLHQPSDLARYFPGQFDALFDFPVYELLQGDHNANGDGLLAGQGFPALLTALLEEAFERYPDERQVVRFLSNHDTNRLRSEMRSDEARMRLAAELLISLPGPIMIYYGEEIGMPGEKGGAPFYDNYRREPMDWYADLSGEFQTTWFLPEDRWNQADDGISVEEQEGASDSLLQHYRTLLQLRAEHPALRQGAMEILSPDVTTRGPVAYALTEGEERIIAVFNFGQEVSLVTFSAEEMAGGVFRNLLTGRLVSLGIDGGDVAVELQPAEALLLMAVGEGS